jgi:ATP-binding cassette subfamily F protein uup
VFEGEGLISDFNGNYTDYMLSRIEEKSDKKEKSKIETPVKQVQEAPVKRKASFKETHELKQLDEAIPALESKITTLTDKLQTCDNHVEMQLISNEIQVLNQSLEVKTNRWLELSDIVSQV